MFKNLFKNKLFFFLVFWLSFRVKEGIWGQNGKMGSVLTIQGQTVKSSLQSPGKLSIFPVLSLFFHLSLSKIWQAHPNKNYIFKINKDRSITSQSLEFEVENCGLRKHLKLGDF